MEEPEQEARRLKSVAEAKYKDSNVKSALKYAKRAERLIPSLEGISSMVTALKIICTASKSPNPDWYKVLQVEPFAHTNTIKKNYKKLAFLLHPDKNPHAGSEEAFKLVNDAVRFLSDKLRRKEYDVKLRIKIQDEKIKESGVGGLGSSMVVESDTFWTACSTCRLLHQFERRYLGHNLVCPSCKKSFKAVEVENGENFKVRTSERLRKENLASKGGMSSEGLGRRVSDSGEINGGTGGKRKSGVLQRKGEVGTGDLDSQVSAGKKKSVVWEKKGEVGTGSLGNQGGDAGELSGWRLRRRMSSVGEVMERSKPKKAKTSDEMMTLAEMKQKAQKEKMKMKLKNKNDERDKKEKRERLSHDKLKKGKNLDVEKRAVSKKDLESDKSNGLSIEKSSRGSKSGNLEIMVVEESDFYDFDKDRVGRSFEKGQVWAAYDDDDGMPRHFGLIDEFWLDLQNNGYEWLACSEKMGFHVSCGRFKVSRKTSINSLSIFSHLVDCERVAREIYCIYPKKGSVWALYSETAFDAEGRNLSRKDKRCYDIVVFLTAYSEMHGMSIGYLEKVDGFKTVFKRREIGSHAVRLLEKSDVRLASHQIPFRKLSGDEAPNLFKDCWELDPASLPPDLLTFGLGR
ncbi:hypothetical protein D8674_039461 [Pyrus ussuriensis x Pyrus communis]|uniref:J domain-containing protein n=1 Tax=Pyrus ussuriensis x Pyrus communis TaxID=2448454 RepID=A0A5N5H3X5_9ROSA|nr:hypothetical protein D8674_039461 [Pyrus ussuriensis x Pyrus communis]